MITLSKTFIPGSVTALNLFFGYLSICSSLQGEVIKACWLIVLAACMDALDGKIARALKATSKFGVEFDSLADVISFGIAPALILVRVLQNIFPDSVAILLSFVFTLAGAVRLARFNTQTRGGSSKKNFSGLPIPAAATAILSYIIFSEHIWGDIHYYKSLIGYIVLLSFLMVSSIEYDTFSKFTLRTLRKKMLLVLFVGCLFLLAWKPTVFLFIFSFTYVLFGISRWVFHARLHVHGEEKDDPVSLGD